MRTFGLIPAAGKSSRMGRPKLLLPVGEQTVLERVVTSVRAGGAAEILVIVAGRRGTARNRRACGAHVLHCEKTHATCADVSAWARLVGGAIPSAVRRWVAAHPSRPSHVPTQRGPPPFSMRQRLHRDRPIVLPTIRGGADTQSGCGGSSLRRLGLPVERGLNAMIRDCADLTLELPCASAEILRDLDTPEDYRELLRDRAWEQ